MNLLTDNTPDFLQVGGKKIKIKTDFALWVRFIIAVEKNDNNKVGEAIFDIMGNVSEEINPKELTNSISKWLWSTQEKTIGARGKNEKIKKAFDFAEDGNIIYCELWEHFPHLMQQGITFQQGVELIKMLIANEKTVIHHRAFARSGDFSQMSNEQRKYWIKERAKYAIKAKQEDIDDAFSSAF